MNAHQVITGALNRGDNAFSVGAVDGVKFTACAVGTDIVILSSLFERVQVIPGSNGSSTAAELVTCVHCCSTSGKIAAVYDKLIRIFEPVIQHSDKPKQKFAYRWFETENLPQSTKVHQILWNLEGYGLLICKTNELSLYHHVTLTAVMTSNPSEGSVKFLLADEECNSQTLEQNTDTWECAWSQKLSSPLKYLSYSPNSVFLATCSENDSLVKIWFNSDDVEEKSVGMHLSFVYLQHPMPVIGFEWRKTTAYISHHSLQNILLTWCEDNTVRLWKETPNMEMEFQLLNEMGDLKSNQSWDSYKIRGKKSKLRATRNRMLNGLKKLMKDKRKKQGNVVDQMPVLDARTSISLTNVFQGIYNKNDVHFHLSATINAHNDCLLVPSMEQVTNGCSSFTVHWLNNKDLTFNMEMEKILVESLLNEQQSSSSLTFDEAHSDDKDSRSKAVHEPCEFFDASGDQDLKSDQHSSLSSSASEEALTVKDPIDTKLELLGKQWIHSSDILFAIHPIDGSLLTWTVECLDDVCRQPVINFTSRIPSAFPISDAKSLNPYLSSFSPHDPVYIGIIHKQLLATDAKRMLERRSADLLFLLTSHENGSLNLWHLSVDDSSSYSSILNISHASRMCGHRFPVSTIVPHPVLPLMLTTSTFSSDKMKDGISELILWETEPVGPLGKSGGIRELARINSLSSNSFRTIAWVPVILPSWTIGACCSSSTTCFIANCDGCMKLYQAVVNAGNLLAEVNAIETPNIPRCPSLSSIRSSECAPESPVKVPGGINLHVVSTQSSSKPGCILRLCEIRDSDIDFTKTILSHVYHERVIWSLPEDSFKDGIECFVKERRQAPSFSERFYLIILEKFNESNRIMMWSIVIASDSSQLTSEFETPFVLSTPQLGVRIEKVWEQCLPLDSGTEIKSAISVAGHLSSSYIYPECNAPYAFLTVCSDDRLRFWKCNVLKNSNGVRMYNWLNWKMMSEANESDLEMEGRIFNVSAAYTGRFACSYLSSDATINGSVIPDKVNVAIFECESSGGVDWQLESVLKIDVPKTYHSDRADTLDENSEEVTEHTLDDDITKLRSLPSHNRLLERVSFPSTAPISPTLKKIKSENLLRSKSTTYGNVNLANFIRMDWVSTEDGSHILTVAVGATMYLYARVSQHAAQRNIVMMKENEIHRRPTLQKMSSLIDQQHSLTVSTRWSCIRFLTLQSADGLPPFPASLQWVRDGLLIVGIQSEIRCFNQWNFCIEKSRLPLEKKSAKESSRKMTFSLKPALSISGSHSILAQLSKSDKFELLTLGKQMRSKLDLMDKIFVPPNECPELISKDENRLEAVNEGLFEAAHSANPILPQYHPKQLIDLLNSGRAREVKLILLHVLQCLKRANVFVPNPLSCASSIRRMSLSDSIDVNASSLAAGHGPTVDSNVDPLAGMNPEYDELDNIAPLPLYMLMTDNTGVEETVVAKEQSSAMFEMYETACNDDEYSPFAGGDERPRRASSSSEVVDILKGQSSKGFTARHNRMLTEMLTHIHLPGLSSVDQMHLLAIADTISHFSPDTIDRFAQANAAPFRPVGNNAMHDVGQGYAASVSGIECVDECGLRFLMAMKQHEYLLLCLPLVQKNSLKMRGLSTASIIWALHSESETDILNLLPPLQKGNPSWEDLRVLGISWWLKGTASLKFVFEKLAKSAFQRHQDPMDTSLYYMALRKKNVLTHLFKTVRDQKMADFFLNDFSEERWKKVALKNAFVLMGKQRFQHAAAFFLLADSLNDATQTILNKLNDLQLAMAVITLYETDLEKRTILLRNLLCLEILHITPSDLDAISRGERNRSDDNIYSPKASHDPFERSMAYWHLKEYSLASSTLLEEAVQDPTKHSVNCSLSDIFNFYAFIRNHALVLRKKLADAGIEVGYGEKHSALCKEITSHVTPSERRLYFRTASTHLRSGCPLLALDILKRMPNTMCVDEKDIKHLTKEYISDQSSADNRDTVNGYDWSAPSNVMKDDKLELHWSDHDEDDGGEIGATADASVSAHLSQASTSNRVKEKGETGRLDVIAQHMKFVACLQILVEELSTLASGFEVDGGQLRFEIFKWLEQEIVILKELCGCETNRDIRSFEVPMELTNAANLDANPSSNKTSIVAACEDQFSNTVELDISRRRWLTENQKIIRAFTSYCTLHCAQNHRLASALMELLLLLLEIQQESFLKCFTESVPSISSFPLLVASISSSRMFVSSPLQFLHNQCSDLLLAISEFDEPPKLGTSFHKVYMMYHLCQGLSSCLYQSLSSLDSFNQSTVASSQQGMLTHWPRSSTTEALTVSTYPSKWPGIDVFAHLCRDKNEIMFNLRSLMMQIFVAVSTSLFIYAFAVYDPRWLYRLAAHTIDGKRFGLIFGGGGTRKKKVAPPARPPRPEFPSLESQNQPSSDGADVSTNDATGDSNFRTKFNSKVLSNNPLNQVNNQAVQTFLRWVPPKKSIVQLFADRPEIKSKGEQFFDYDSDVEPDEEEDINVDEYGGGECSTEHSPDSYSWLLMHIALIRQHLYRLEQFVLSVGFDLNDLATFSPKVSSVFKILHLWERQMMDNLARFPGGCSTAIIPNCAVQEAESDIRLSLRKYRVLLEPGNTPFESGSREILSVRRLWSFLVHQSHLMPIFIRHIFAKNGEKVSMHMDSTAVSDNRAEVYKIIRKDSEPITAFACSRVASHWLVIATPRELQELNIKYILDSSSSGASSSWISNCTELDIHLSDMTQDPLKDNDDYQFVVDVETKSSSSNFLTQFIIDRSRFALRKLLKRQIHGIRRIDSHPSLPYYVTGSSDGSIRLWEWGVGQPLFTPRVSGQYAKVTKVVFSSIGNKLAAVDTDGLLCLWQVSQGLPIKKPFFNQKCHSKSAADVLFLNSSSSTLVTAGCSSGDQNICLWDTLMPQSKSLVHSWVAHPDGATSVLYFPSSQTVVSGGRHGEMCFWDMRQRQLRATLKAFDNSVVKCLISDPSSEYIIAGSGEGDIKVWSAESASHPLMVLNGEHAARSGFSLRQAASSVQGVQQIYIDSHMQLFSCGADNCLKLRRLDGANL